MRLASVQDTSGASSGHLRRLLLDLGVGQPGMSQRALAKASGDRLSKDTWWRMTKPIPPGERGHRWKVEDLRVVADTLRKVGARVSFEQIERAALADLGYGHAAGSDYNEALALASGLSE